MQHKAVYYFAISLYMFRASITPIMNTQNCNYSLQYCAPNSLQRGQASWPTLEVAAQKIWPVPEAVYTVLCTPDDGCGWHPKHVEWPWRLLNRLLCVASRWTIIYICYNFLLTITSYCHIFQTVTIQTSVNKARHYLYVWCCTITDTLCKEVRN